MTTETRTQHTPPKTDLLNARVALPAVVDCPVCDGSGQRPGGDLREHRNHSATCPDCPEACECCHGAGAASLEELATYVRGVFGSQRYCLDYSNLGRLRELVAEGHRVAHALVEALEQAEVTE